MFAIHDWPMDKNKIIQAATKYVQKAQYDKAIKEYQRIIDEDPRDIRILLKIGELHQKRGDNKEAAAALLRVAEAYSNDGFFLKAAAVYKQVLKLNPALLDVNLRLAELYQQLGLMSDAMLQYQLVANAYEKQGNARASLNLLKKLVDLEPDNAASRVRLAESYSNEGMTQEAIAELGRVAEQLKQSGRNDEFIKVAERLLFLDATNVVLTRELANLYLGRGDTKRALAKLQICFKADPEDIDTLILLAQTFLDLGQQAKTVSVYKELAKIYAERGRREEELATWRRVLALVPHDPDALHIIGGDAPVEEAELETEFEAVSETQIEPVVPPPRIGARDGRFADVQKLLTETDVYLKYGLHDKAADHLRRILAAAPESIAAHQKAKELHLLTGDLAAVAAELVIVAHLSFEEGNSSQAKVFVEQLREVAPEHPEIRVLERLVGAVTELREVGEDEAILVEALPDDEPLQAGLPLADEELLVDDPAPNDFAADEALVIPTLASRLTDSGGDPPLLSQAAEGFDADVAALVDEPLVDDAGELGREALSAIGFESPEAEVGDAIDDFLAAPPIPPALSRPMTRPLAPMSDFEQTQTHGVLPPKHTLSEETRPGRLVTQPRLIVPPAPLSSPPSSTPVGRSAATLPPSPASIRPVAVSPRPSPASVRPLPSPVRPHVAPIPAPSPPTVPPPVEDDPAELAEAEFFLDQDLLDDAAEAIASLRALLPRHPSLRGKIEGLEARLLAARPAPTPLSTPAVGAVASFDLAAAVEQEVAKSGEPASQGDFQYSVEDVLSEFKKGIERAVRPEDVETHFELGIAYKEMGLIDEAVSEFETALRGAQGKPKEPDCLAMIGVCLGNKGEFAKAGEAFERALRAKALKPEARLNLYFEIGSTREASGDLAGALDAFEKVARVDPGYRDVGAWLTRVRAAKASVSARADDLDAPHDGVASTSAGVEPSRSGKIGYV